MANVLVACAYGDSVLGAACCLVNDGEFVSYVRCAVYDWEKCPFGRKVEGCGTCAHACAMTESDGERMVDCEINEMQMYSPYAAECWRWERALG
ncbi:MAG: hypothetical protein IJ092_06340 [Atopobiaceae bacterium]|nr:hypothetical protein [Atopobiaceae bacterium]